MKHILISYDFLTTQAHVGKQSVEKLHFLAEILTNLGMNPTLDSDLTHVFPIKKFFELINQDYPNQMVNFVEPDINSVESNELVIDYLAGVDLLIAYELSPQSRHYFDCLGISYIDIWFSPLRFCKDVMFSFYSNVASIQKHLISNRTPDAFFYQQAELLSEHCDNFMLNDIEIEPDSALIIGQLFIDKACQKGTKFLNLLDYKARIRDIAANHQKVYLIKHPLMPEKDFSKIVSGLNIEKLVYLQNVNVYELMSNKNVKTVIAVSSSVLKEAKYFNKQVVCLYKSPIDDNYVNIYECFFDAQFWINVLQLTDLTSTWSYYHYDNFLRHKFDAFYAYEKFAKNTIALSADQEAQLVYQSLVDLGRNIEAVNKYQSVVLYGYGTVAKLILPQLSVPVRGIVDKALTMKNIVEIDDISVLTPLDLVDGDNVVICAFKYNHEIKVQLNSIGKNLNITSLL